MEKKIKQWAFHHIQRFTHYHKEKNNAIFLPDALSHGNYGALTKFLGNLRSNKINSFIKLNMEESKGYFDKAATMLKPITKITHIRLQAVFTQLKSHMAQQQEKERILIDIERISSIENKESEVSEPSPKVKQINVTFVPIRINPEKISEMSHRKESVSYREHSVSKRTNSSKNSISTFVDIGDLIDDRKIKKYEFKHITTVKLDGEKVTYSRNL